MQEVMGQVRVHPALQLPSARQEMKGAEWFSLHLHPSRPFPGSHGAMETLLGLHKTPLSCGRFALISVAATPNVLG